VSLLELRDVVVDYHRRGSPPIRAVAGVDLAIERGQIVGLVGESGCGKSSLARAIVGIVPVTAGTIRYDGRVLGPLRRRARPRSELGLQLVFQNPYSSLNPRRTVASHLVDGLDERGVTDRKEQRRAIDELLERVALPASAKDRYPHQFSGGQRQRIAVARALAAAPSLIILDEPLASLDASAQAQMANLLADLSRSTGVALLLISHDLGLVRYIADTIEVMYLGQIVERGPTDAVWDSPLHPYTRALVAAVPRADGENNLPASLPGEVPDPARPPSGCRFHPRCPNRFEPCDEAHPGWTGIGDRRVACWLHTTNGIAPARVTARSSTGSEAHAEA
jgi:peptide/nickel transport system ATP-binding protein